MYDRLVVLSALAVVPAIATAQGSAADRRSLPFFSADALLGVTTGPSRVGPISYRGTTATAGRITLAVRLGSAGAVRPVLVVDYSWMPGNPSGDDLCLGPNNTPCAEEFPEYSGFGAGLGVRALVGSRLTLGATAGIARYQDHFTTSPNRRTAGRLDADVAYRLGRHLGAVLNIRHVAIQSPGYGAWIRPITFGLRIQ